MAKTLLLMRHGEAANAAPDIERQLTDNGINEVIRAARQLQSHGLVLQQILHSTAERTRATAEYLSQINRFDPSIMDARSDLYQSTVGGLLQVINNLPNSADTVGIIGHNPTLSYLVEYLATNANNIYLDTANIVLLQFEVDTWVGVDQYVGTLSWHYKE